MLTIAFLERLEDELRTQHCNPRLVLSDYFDMIGGTSVGAILATQLALGESGPEDRPCSTSALSHAQDRQLSWVTCPHCDAAYREREIWYPGLVHSWMEGSVRRREFLATFGGVVVWPLTGHAQRSTMPVIGFLTSSSPDAIKNLMSAFNRGLVEAGYVEGKNVAIEHRWAGSEYERFRLFAADLVNRRVTILFAGGGGSAASAAKAVTAIIPIVFVSAGDPVELGLVASLNRPGGNVTGVSFLSSELEAKRLGLLHELVPNATMVAVIMNPNFLDAAKHLRNVQEAGRALGLPLLVLNASSERDIDAAFATLVHKRAGALLVLADAFLFSRREQLVALAARHAIPAIYSYREFATAGGLTSYATSLVDAYRQAGLYVGRILNGEKPADLPVVQANKFEFVINLKTAKALGITVPPALLAGADEVIE